MSVWLRSRDAGRHVVLGMIVMAVAIAAAYSRSLDGEFVWDDDRYVSTNVNLRSADGLVRIWAEPLASPQYYPLVFSSFWAEYHLWGLAPRGYHVTNLALHILNALLLWAVLRRLAVPGAWLGAMLFGLHPVHVESVAWISERKNVLSGFFSLLALLAWLRHAGPTAGETVAGGGAEVASAGAKKAYGLTLLLFACALLSKTIAASLPATLLLLAWWKRGRLERKQVVLVIPLAALGVVAGLATVWLERHHVGALGQEWMLSPVQRALIAGRALWFYAAKLLWPSPLSFVYPRWTVDASVLWQYLFPLSWVSMTAALWVLRERLGRGPLTAVLFFAGTLTPALGFFDVYPFRFSWVADHFQYLASVGPLALSAAVVSRLAHKIGALSLRSGARVGISCAAAALVLAPVGVLTWRHVPVYRSLETLWRDTLSKNPEAWLAHNNLGRLLYAQGKTEEAISHYREALRIQPTDALLHTNLGIALAKQGDLEEAVREHRTAVRLLPAYPNSYNNLGIALALQGKTLEAVAEYAEALRRSPDYAEAHLNMGRALLSVGRREQALYHFRRAVRANPGSAPRPPG